MLPEALECKAPTELLLHLHTAASALGLVTNGEKKNHIQLALEMNRLDYLSAVRCWACGRGAPPG